MYDTEPASRELVRSKLPELKKRADAYVKALAEDQNLFEAGYAMIEIFNYLGGEHKVISALVDLAMENTQTHRSS